MRRSYPRYGAIFYSLVFCCSFAPSLLAQSFVVVAGETSPLSSMSKYDISNVYLDKTREVSGIAIEPLDLKEWTSVKNDFYRDVIKKNASQLNAYWARKLFTGRGKPPRNFKDIRSLSHFLQKNPKAIAYMPASAVARYPVKVLYRQ